MGKVLKLFDYHKANIPREETLWRVPDAEIQEQLATIAVRHRDYQPAGTVESGDAAYCVCEGAKTLRGRKTVLLYPGLGLPGAEDAEAAVQGKNLGEVFQTVVRGENLELRVEKILRPCPPPAITDELIRQENIEGVESVEDYARWYRSKNEPERKESRPNGIYRWLLEEVTSKSEFDFGETELADYVDESVKVMYADMVEQGVASLQVAEDGTPMTEEQALERLKEECAPHFEMMYRIDLVRTEWLSQFGITISEADVEAAFPEFGVAPGQEEAMQDDFRARIRSNLEDDKLKELLADDLKNYLEV